ncbi:hypothetical protein GGS21DRAFT_458697 [Xylaria nigripes]|nr:hypothetical protein GGS21DRAFT_458697 [Xylaria nigripes]
MSGLTLNTEAAVSRSQQHQPPANRASTTAANVNTSTRPIQSTTPIPVPVPIPYTSREPNQSSPLSSSPLRPTYSPITPPLNPIASPPRPTFTHNTHAGATAMPPPPPEPIDFASNPDVLALKSAISILQMQRKKAERDMATLSRVKSTALAEPEAFVRDLTAGRVRMEGEGLFLGGGRSGDSDSDSDSEVDKDEHREDLKRGTGTFSTHPQPKKEEKAKIKPDPEAKMPDPPPWTSLPKPQNIVRCPPINWSQYAVVGESLDKLHNEQLRRPSQGMPASLTPDGHFEFKGDDGGDGGKQEEYLGVAAPYAPLRDKINRKSKGPFPKQ